MPKISYAQNFEDILLARVFAGMEPGFYIDVGAWHPVADSVTKRFYDEGWRGVNIEPVPTYFELIKADRPRDTNLQIGIGDKDGVLKLTVFEGSGGSSFDPMFQEHFVERGFEGKEIEVQVTTLARIFEQYAPKDRPVDFLKIDVEGWEPQAIAGNDWNRFRPKVVLIEATLPNSPTPHWHMWEPAMLANEYHFVWFDGLNRWYVDRDHQHLKMHFERPIGLFDDFITIGHHAALQQAELAQGKLPAADPSDPVSGNTLAWLQWKMIEEAQHRVAANRASPVSRFKGLFRS